MKTSIAILFSLLLWLCVGGTVRADTTSTNSNCAVCGKLLFGKIWKYKDWLICDDCAKLKDRCSICGLPAKAPFTTTGDGRAICHRCESIAVLKQDQAKELLDETRRQIVALTRGRMELKQPEITLSLFDIDYWNTVGGKPVSEVMRRPALSQSRATPQGFVHNILLWSGMSIDETRSCLAHEYTHLWINENLVKDRKLVQRTVEGLCELVAYKLDEDLKVPDQLDKIRKNGYTQGRIVELIDVEKRFSLNSLLLWVSEGQGEEIDESTLGQPSAPPASKTPETPLSAIPQARPTYASTLLLRGLIGSGARRMALINGSTFTKGEKGQVRLTDRTLQITCIDILDRSVVIQVEGEEKPRTLSLE